MTGSRHRLSHLNYLDEPLQEEVADNYIADDLALFTNAQFFDFDMSPAMPSEDLFSAANEPVRQAPSAPMDPTINFVDYGDFDFSKALTDLPTTVPTTFDTTPTTSPGTIHQTRYNPPTLLPNAPLAPVAPTAITSPISDHPSPASGVLHAGSKRKASTVSSDDGSPHNYSLEDASRIAAEEDKRRRNTAASARFRVKKKQREQALERTAKEMSEKVGKLEARINQLEMENKWLKNLITEKNGSNSKEEIAEMFASKFSSAQASLVKEKADNKQ